MNRLLGRSGYGRCATGADQAEGRSPTATSLPGRSGAGSTTQCPWGSPPNTGSCICPCVSLVGVGTYLACCYPTCREKAAAPSSEENTGSAGS